MRKPRERSQLIGLALAAAVAWGIAVYFSLARRGEADAPVADATSIGAPTSSQGATTSASAASIAPIAPSQAEPGARPAASSSASPAQSATAVSAAHRAAAPADPTACVKALFAPDAFLHGKTDFSFICTDPYPRTSITKVQAQVLLGRGSTSQMTDGMREWATLGWYQLAAYALFRGRCCSSPPKLDWTFDLACPLDEAMVALERAVATNDLAALELAIDRYTKEARCITKLGQAANFGQSALPGQGMNSLRKLLERMRQADGG